MFKDSIETATPKYVTVNGTKVISATSFVISIDVKKQSEIKIKESVRKFFVLQRRELASAEKTPFSRNPAIMPIRQKSNDIVLKSMYETYSADGGVKNIEITASIADTQSTVSFLIKS